MLGGPAAQTASSAAQPAEPVGQPVPSAAEHRPQNGRLQQDAQHSSNELHRGEPLDGSPADTAMGSHHVAPATNGLLTPGTTAAGPAAAGKKAAAVQPAIAAGAACHPESRHLAALRPTVAVAVAVNQGAAQALVLAGALALQVIA